MSVKSLTMQTDISSTPSSTRIIQPSVIVSTSLRGLRLTKYQIYMPITYVLNQFGLAFSTILAVFLWLLLEKRSQLWAAVSPIKFTPRMKATKPDVNQAYVDTPAWWYLVTAALSLFLAMFCCEYWKVQLPWYGVLLAFAVSIVFFVPVSHTASQGDHRRKNSNWNAAWHYLRYNQP
jgi:hypothetical protein